MFENFLQVRPPGAMFEVRTAQEASSAINAIREAVRQVDAGLPITDVSTQQEQLENRMAQERSLAQAYTLFGALAVALAAIGLFGLMSYSVARRTNEIGVRMALGADRGRVLLLIMRESMLLVGLGAVIGLVAAAASTRVIASQLFGLAATDVTTHAAAAAIVVAVSALAGYLPARRASRVDPMVALRYE
jgi:ABC-type antimicrobial peptide transport system permease subunit